MRCYINEPSKADRVSLMYHTEATTKNVKQKNRNTKK